MLITFISSLSFANVFRNGEKLTESFLENKKYIKIIEDTNNIRYIMFDSIIYIRLDEDDIKIITKGISDGDGRENDTFCYDTIRWNIVVDDNSNIIISRKNRN